MGNIYEDQRKQAYDRLLQQLAAKQAYVNYQAQKDAQAQKLEATRARQAAPGGREINWAGKGLAAGGPWGALIGAVAARGANAYDSYQEGGPDRGKNVATRLFGLGDLKNAVKYSAGANADADALAGAAGQERARASTARRNARAMQSNQMNAADTAHFGGVPDNDAANRGGSLRLTSVQGNTPGMGTNPNSEFANNDGSSMSEEERQRRGLYGPGSGLART